MKVVSLDDYRAHRVGGAVCLACRHQWTAVAPVGTPRLECPKCDGMTGRFLEDLKTSD